VPARRPLLAALALVALTVAAYGTSLGNAFVNYDDDLYITDRPELRDGLSRQGLAWAFTSTQGANWFPLTRLSWMLDAELFGVEAGAFHATSLALHLLGTLLLFLAMCRMSGDLWPSAFVAAVFAVHPLHVESVTWAAARKDLVSGVFFMLALLAHERRARGERSGAWGALVFAAMALGLMAKPMLVTLPCVLLLLDAWPLRRLDRVQLRTALVEKLPLVALAAAASAVTVIAQGAGGALQSAERYPLMLRLANAVDAYAVYLGKAVWPAGLAVFYPYPHGGIPLGRSALAAALLAGITAWTLRERRRRPYLLVGWLWFAGMLVPVSGIVQVGQAARADRYTYLPLIGLTLMLAWGARELAQRRPATQPLLRSGAVVAVLLLALVTASQVATWRDSRSLFEHALRVTERNHVAHINLGLALARAGEVEEAERHLVTAVALAPTSPRAHGLLGEVRVARDQHPQAGEDFRRALGLEPGSARWETGLGRVLLEAGDLEGAEAALGRALAAEPERADTQAFLGLVAFRSGRVDAAIASYRRALADQAAARRALGAKGLARLHGQLGTALATRGETEAAVAVLGRALAIDPDQGDVQAVRGALFDRLGDEAQAIAAYREALGLGERTLPVLNDLAWLLASARDPALRAPEQAVSLAEEAVRLSGGDDAYVLDTLAIAYQRAGRPGRARSTARRALELAEAREQQELAREIRRRLAEAGEIP
jgi:tetratricopeptide (TPR) repeat protein